MLGIILSHVSKERNIYVSEQNSRSIVFVPAAAVAGVFAVWEPQAAALQVNLPV